MGFAVYHVSLEQVFIFFWIPRFSPLCYHCISSACSYVRHPRNAYLVSTFDSAVGIPHHKGESRLRLKYDGTRAETRFRLSGKRTSQFKLAWASVQSTSGSRGVRISGGNSSNAGTPCSEVVWRVLATHSIRQFPLHFPSRASPCAITFQLDSTTVSLRVCVNFPFIVARNAKQVFGHRISCRPQEQTLKVAWSNLQLMIATDSFTEISVRITRLWANYRNLALNIISRLP